MYALSASKPPSSVFKSCNLRGRFFAAFFLEQDVIVGAGIKRRVEVDQVHTFRGHVLAEDSQVVAEVEFIRPVH